MSEQAGPLAGWKPARPTQCKSHLCPILAHSITYNYTGYTEPAPTITAQISSSTGTCHLDLLLDPGADISAAGQEILEFLCQHFDNILPLGIDPRTVNRLVWYQLGSCQSPFVYKDKLKEKLEILQEQGIIARVTEVNEWFAPIVHVVTPKKGQTRLGCVFIYPI